jgi:putative transposase
VLDILVQCHRNAKVAKRLLRKLLRKRGAAPRVMITDKLASYAAVMTAVMPGVENPPHQGLNNRAEIGYPPTQRRERVMKCVKAAGQAQPFLSIHDQIANPPCLERSHGSRRWLLIRRLMTGRPNLYR